jgi:hypothetical protein
LNFKANSIYQKKKLKKVVVLMKLVDYEGVE